ALLFVRCGTAFAGDHAFSGMREERHAELARTFTEEWDQQKNSYCDRKHLFGDWRGWRKYWAKRGVTVTSSYVVDMLGNPVGGMHQGAAYTGSYGIDALYDLEKIHGLRGWEFYIAGTWRAGTNLSKTKIGNQFPVAQVYGGQTWRLGELYFQNTGPGERWHFKFGRLEAGNNFLQNPLYYSYVSNAFDGNPISVFFNVYFTAYPNATWGVYFDYKITPRILAKFAVYNANADVNRNVYNGFNFHFTNTQGTQYITEWTYLVNQEPCDIGLPGNYKVGYFYYPAVYDKFLGGEVRGNYGYYFLFDQMIYRPCGPGTDQGLTPFVALLFFPEDRNTFPFFFTSGLVYNGLIPWRCNDVAAFGVAYGSYSSDLRQQERQQMLETQNFEMIIEANYKIVMTPWFYIQPDLQYIIKPKGYDSIEDAMVIGFQSGLTF
ncbi:MAG: carbohydrate porin, partial [Chlamydiia bacterium]|nr:carbohydrate porin [Chlamydiia bacterium]